jgi:hypothetical protein
MTCDRTRTVRFTAAVALAASAALAAACGGSSNPTTVTAPTGTVVTDTFTGTVQPGGASINNFNVTVGGTVSVTLVSAGPPPTITMGLGVGNPGATGTCSFLQNGTITTTAGSTAQLSGSIAAGTYCVAVVDIGNAAGAITYTVTVAHT